MNDPTTPVAVEAEQLPVPWADLDKWLLQLIFSKVPQRHRLGHGSCCALVCSSWAEAAAAATDSIGLEQCADTDSLQVWLHEHGQNVTKLHVSAASGVLTHLPCPKLTQLLLQGDSLLAAPGLPATLAALPSLQHLTLRISQDKTTATTLTTPSTQIRPLPPGLLQQLGQQGQCQHVTYIKLVGGLSDAALSELSRLTQCSRLVLRHVSLCEQAVDLTELQELQMLTCWHLSGSSTGTLSTHSLPDFSKFKALRHLHLARITGDVQLQPKQLPRLSGLAHLHLMSMTLQGGAVGGAELLAVLPQLNGSTYPDQ